MLRYMSVLVFEDGKLLKLASGDVVICTAMDGGDEADEDDDEAFDPWRLAGDGWRTDDALEATTRPALIGSKRPVPAPTCDSEEDPFRSLASIASPL